MTSSVIDAGWHLLLDIALKSCLLCALAGVGLLLLRRASAASHHLVLRLLLGALLALPLLSFVLPRWQIHWQPPVMPEPMPPSATVSRVDSDVVVAVTPPLSRSETSIPIEPDSHSSFVDTVPLSPSLDAPAVRGNIAADASRFWQSDALKRNALALWLLGGMAVLARFLAGGIATNRLRRRSLPVTEKPVRQLAAEAQKETGFRRGVTLLQMPGEASVRVPIVWGLFRPAILLPAGLLDWPPERLRLILLHEMAHLRRHDGLAQAVGQMTCALLWFHPMVWWAAHRMREECERACDDSVLLTGIAPSTYADTLLEVIRMMKNSRSFPQSALSMARPPIEKRLHAILSRRPIRLRTLQRPVAALIWLGTAACVLPLAALHVNATPVPRKMQSFQVGALPDFGISEDQAVNVTRLAQAEEQEGRAARRSQQDINNELDLLRERLMAMEQALKRSQQENRDLRRQLERVRAQQARTDRQQETELLKQRLKENEALMKERRKEEAALLKQRQKDETLPFEKSEEVLRAKRAREDEQARVEAEVLKNRRRHEADSLKQKQKLEKEEEALLKARSKEEKARLKQKQKEETLPEKKGASAAQEDQLRALENALAAMRQENEVLRNQLIQKEELYKAGVSNAAPVQRAKTRLEQKQLRTQALEQQLNDLKDGRKISPKEQERRQLQQQRELLQIEMQMYQQELQTAKQQYEAGQISKSTLLEAEQRVAGCKTKLSEIEILLKR